VAQFHSYTQTVADGTATSVVRPSDWNSAHVLQYGLSGNTVGSSAVSGSDVIFVGGNNLSLSADTANSRLVFSVGNYLTTARGSTDAVGLNTAKTNVTWTVNSSGISFDAGGYAGTGYTSTTTAGTAVVGTHGTNGLSIGVPAFITTARGSTDAVGLNTAKTNVTWTVNSSGISFDAGGYAGTGTSATNASVTLNSNGLQISVAAAGAATNAVGLNTAKTNVTWTVNSSGLSFDAGGYAGTGYTSTTTAGTAIVGTLNTAGLSVGVPAFITTAMQSNAATISNINVSGGTTSSNMSAVNFVNSNGVSWSLDTASKVYATVKTDYLTTARGSTDAVGLNTAKTNVTWTVNSSGISFDAGKYAGTGYTSATTAGTAIVGTLNTAGLSVGVPAFITTAMQSNAATISNINVSGGTTSSNLSAINFVNSNGVSWSLDTASKVYATVKTDYLTTARASSDGVGLNTAQTNVTWTVNSSGLSLNASGYAGIGTSATNASVTLNSNGLAISVAGAGAATNAVGLNTAQTNVTWTVNTSGISLNAAGYAGTGTTFTNVTATLNSVGLQLNAAGYAGTGTSATNASVTLNSNGLAISVAAPTSNYVNWLEPFSQTNTAGLALGVSSWYFAPFVAPENISGGRINFLAVNTSTAGILAYQVNPNTNRSRNINAYTYDFRAALYSQGTGTNSTRLESFWSNRFSFNLTADLSVVATNATDMAVSISRSIGYIQDIDASGGYVLSTYGAGSNITTPNSSMNQSAFASVGTSIRNMLSDSIIQPVGLNTTLAPGAYWMAVQWASTSAVSSTNSSIGNLIFSQLSIVGVSRVVLDASFRNWGSTATTARSGIAPYGVYTAQSAVPPQFVALNSDLSSLASAWVPYFNFQARGLTN